MAVGVKVPEIPEATATVSVKLTAAPGATTPTTQDTVAPGGPHVSPLAETNVIPAGRVNVTSASVTVDGPVLDTDIA